MERINFVMTDAFHFLLMRCFHESNRRVTQGTAALGLFPGQPKILECLRESDGALARDIGTRCGIDKSTMSSLLRKIEGNGLIARRTDEHDRRAVRIYLTDAGKEAAERVSEITDEVDRFALRNLSESQRKALEDALQIVLRTFQEFQEQDGGGIPVSGTDELPSGSLNKAAENSDAAASAEE